MNKACLLVLLAIVALTYATAEKAFALGFAMAAMSDSAQETRCTNVADSLNVRNAKFQIVSTLGPETPVNFYGKQTINGEDMAKIGTDQFVAARFLKMKCSPVPAGSDCGVAYDNGSAVGRKQCTTIDGKAVVTTTAVAYNKMKAAASAAGITLRINSGFRTQAEQQYFYNCYVTGSCNGGNLAAKPGYSNHQNGLALDINVTSDSTYNWLRNNASKFGFVRTVASEEWHWELRNSACNKFVGYTCK